MYPWLLYHPIILKNGPRSTAAIMASYIDESHQCSQKMRAITCQQLWLRPDRGCLQDLTFGKAQILTTVCKGAEISRRGKNPSRSHRSWASTDPTWVWARNNNCQGLIALLSETQPESLNPANPLAVRLLSKRQQYRMRMAIKLAWTSSASERSIYDSAAQPLWLGAVLESKNLCKLYGHRVCRRSSFPKGLRKCEKKFLKGGIGISLDNGFMVDGTKQGNMSRFINHCCTTNVPSKIRDVDWSPRVFFLASRDIEAGKFSPWFLMLKTY